MNSSNKIFYSSLSISRRIYFHSSTEKQSIQYYPNWSYSAVLSIFHPCFYYYKKTITKRICTFFYFNLRMIKKYFIYLTGVFILLAFPLLSSLLFDLIKLSLILNQTLLVDLTGLLETKQRAVCSRLIGFTRTMLAEGGRLHVL